MVITSCTRNAVTLYRVRGFESHTLRQMRTAILIQNCGFFYSFDIAALRKKAFILSICSLLGAYDL